MVQFLCENLEVEEAFRELCQQIAKNGGLVHEDLIIQQQGRGIAICAPESIAEDEFIIKVHKSLLLKRPQFNIKIKDNQFVLSDFSQDVSAEQLDVMKCMLRIYNLTHKLEEHRDISVLQLIHKDPEMIKMLLEARDEASMILVDKMSSKDFDEALVDGFLKTRYLGVKFGEQQEQCLMPLIDFLDHHTQAQSYNLPDGDDVFLATVKSTVLLNSDVAMVRYGIMDALDTLLNYNFVDSDAIFVRSVPLRIAMEGVGTVNVKSVLGVPRHDVSVLPDALKGLGVYLPSIVADSDNKRLDLGFLMIPQAGAPKSMRRILAAGLGMIAPTASPDQVFGYVTALEKQVIRHNIIFYNDLREKLDNHQRVAGCEVLYDRIYQMIDCQIGNIRKYPFIETIDVSDLLNEK